MNWTNTLPTEPGWYWVHTAPQDDPLNVVTEIVELDGLGPEWALDEVGLLMTEHTRWYGPLPMPELTPLPRELLYHLMT